MPIPQGLYTLAEAAASLGLNESSVRYAVHRGVLRATPIDGRTYGISAEEIERYRREHLRKRGPKAKEQGS